MCAQSEACCTVEHSRGNDWAANSEQGLEYAFQMQEPESKFRSSRKAQREV